jgi:hypothetical protein
MTARLIAAASGASTIEPSQLIWRIMNKERSMRRWMIAAALACSVGLPPALAWAERADEPLLVAQRGQDREAQRRDERRDQRRERRREPDRQQREYLTPDEHRELNRDLERANREIYRKGRERR